MNHRGVSCVPRNDNPSWIPAKLAFYLSLPAPDTITELQDNRNGVFHRFNAGVGQVQSCTAELSEGRRAVESVLPILFLYLSSAAGTSLTEQMRWSLRRISSFRCSSWEKVGVKVVHIVWDVRRDEFQQLNPHMSDGKFQLSTLSPKYGAVINLLCGSVVDSAGESVSVGQPTKASRSAGQQGVAPTVLLKLAPKLNS